MATIKYKNGSTWKNLTYSDVGAAASFTVSNNNPTLSLGTTSTVGSVAGTALKVTMPSTLPFIKILYVGTGTVSYATTAYSSGSKTPWMVYEIGSDYHDLLFIGQVNISSISCTQTFADGSHYSNSMYYLRLPVISNAIKGFWSSSSRGGSSNAGISLISAGTAAQNTNVYSAPFLVHTPNSGNMSGLISVIIWSDSYTAPLF